MMAQWGRLGRSVLERDFQATERVLMDLIYTENEKRPAPYSAAEFQKMTGGSVIGAR